MTMKKNISSAMLATSTILAVCTHTPQLQVTAFSIQVPVPVPHQQHNRQIQRLGMGMGMGMGMAPPLLMSMSMSMNNENDNENDYTNDHISSRKAFLAKIATTATASAILNTPSIANAKDLPKTGAKAPDFDLPNSRGNGSSTLATLTDTGKWTVLYFYPGAFTSGCTLEARGFQRDLQEYRNLNSQIVGVSVDTVEKNAQFCSEEKLDFYMLSDEKGEVSRKYGSALTIPGFGSFSNRQTYIIDPNGNLRHVFTDVESHVARHSAEVLEKLKELQA